MLPFGKIAIVPAGSSKDFELLPPIIQHLFVERCHARKKPVLISIPDLSHVSNVIYLLLFVKFFYILFFAHLKLITWLDVSWSYLPPVQGSECHNESRKMSPDQFLFSPHTPAKKQRNSSQGKIKRSFH